VLMHKLPKPEVPKRKVNVVGPDDITEGDMDPPKHATCHHLIGDNCITWAQRVK
jgi:hypothetical protein